MFFFHVSPRIVCTILFLHSQHQTHHVLCCKLVSCNRMLPSYLDFALHSIHNFVCFFEPVNVRQEEAIMTKPPPFTNSSACVRSLFTIGRRALTLSLTVARSVVISIPFILKLFRWCIWLKCVRESENYRPYFCFVFWNSFPHINSNWSFIADHVSNSNYSHVLFCFFESTTSLCPLIGRVYCSVCVEFAAWKVQSLRF